MSGEQLGLELAIVASQAAADRAERLAPGFNEKALAAFRRFAQSHDRFTTEDVIAASPEVPRTSDKRSWGGVARRAAFVGICEKVGMSTSKLPYAHQRSVTVWNSKIFQGASR